MNVIHSLFDIVHIDRIVHIVRMIVVLVITSSTCYVVVRMVENILSRELR